MSSVRTDAERHIDRLRDAGLVGRLEQFAVALVLYVADAADRSPYGYVAAMLAGVLRTARNLLPTAAIADGDPIQTYIDTVVDQVLNEQPAPLTAKPLRCTQPTPGARHETRQVQLLARLLGYTLMPWQLLALRILTELDPSGVGWRWKTVVITVPRQSGKTFLLAMLQLQRAITRAHHLCRYTAQTGKDAWKRWLELVGLFSSGPATAQRIMVSLLRGKSIDKGVYRGAGSPTVFLRNRSEISPFTPGPAGLDGGQSDTLIVDEAFVWTLEEGEALEASVNPTKITRPWRQKIIVSTRGTEASTWLIDWLARAADALDDPDSRIALIDFSVPDGVDLYAEETLARYHPAYGYTITLDALQEEMAGPRSVWERSYCNRQVALAGELIVDADLWTSLELEQRTPLPKRFAGYAISVARDRSAATITASWTKGRKIFTAVLERRPGTTWLADRLASLGPGPIYAMPAGPTLTVLDALPKKVQRRITRLNPRGYATACQSWLDYTWSSAAWHAPTPGLDDQLAGASTRASSGCLVLDADKSLGPIDQIEATALATWAATTKPTEDQVF